MSTHLLNLSLLSPQLPKFHLVFESDGQTPMAKQKVRNGSRKKSWSREQYKPPSIERERDFHQPHHCIVFPYAYHYSLDVHSNATTSCLPIHPTVYILYMFVLYFCSPDGTSCTYLLLVGQLRRVQVSSCTLHVCRVQQIHQQQQEACIPQCNLVLYVQYCYVVETSCMLVHSGKWKLSVWWVVVMFVDSVCCSVSFPLGKRQICTRATSAAVQLVHTVCAEQRHFEKPTYH